MTESMPEKYEIELSGIMGSSELNRPSRKNYYWLRLKLNSSSRAVYDKEGLKQAEVDGCHLFSRLATKGPLALETEDGTPYSCRIPPNSSAKIFLTKHYTEFGWRTILQRVQLKKSPLPSNQD